MKYRNTEIRLDQLVGYLNEEKIDLSPVFQRGNVWKLLQRRRLIENIVQGRPIPAIFLYKQAAGSKYTYNILDGKQRLESLILFIANRRTDFQIKSWAKYFSNPKVRSVNGFSIQMPTSRPTIATLGEDEIRELREYAIPTVEISMDDDSQLDEIINLFVDINQYGVKVSRFDIVKAMSKNSGLLKSVFDLIAIRQTRGTDVFYKTKSNDFTQVLKAIKTISVLNNDNRSQVDRMWQQLLEIVLFHQTKKHRKPVDILKSFITAAQDQAERFPNLKASDQAGVRSVFKFLNASYKTSGLKTTSLAADQTRFYTMVTSLMDSGLLTTIPHDQLAVKLVAFGDILDNKTAMPTAIKSKVEKYLELSRDRTTDAPRRDERQQLFLGVVRGL